MFTAVLGQFTLHVLSVSLGHTTMPVVCSKAIIFRQWTHLLMVAEDCRVKNLVLGCRLIRSCLVDSIWETQSNLTCCCLQWEAGQEVVGQETNHSHCPMYTAFHSPQMVLSTGWKNKHELSTALIATYHASSINGAVTGTSRDTRACSHVVHWRWNR